MPGRWPQPALARYKNKAGTWVLDAENTRAVDGAGLVCGAVFSDLNGTVSLS